MLCTKVSRERLRKLDSRTATVIKIVLASYLGICMPVFNSLGISKRNEKRLEKVHGHTLAASLLIPSNPKLLLSGLSEMVGLWSCTLWLILSWCPGFTKEVHKNDEAHKMHKTLPCLPEVVWPDRDDKSNKIRRRVDLKLHEVSGSACKTTHVYAYSFRLCL